MKKVYFTFQIEEMKAVVMKFKRSHLFKEDREKLNEIWDLLWDLENYDEVVVEKPISEEEK